MILPGATKKSAVRDHIQSMREKMAAELKEAEKRLREEAEGRREAEKREKRQREENRLLREELETLNKKIKKK